MSGPYASETKADAWLFEHSKFLRKHFSPQGPTSLPSKHELVQERAAGDGDVFSRETKMDAALFEHSKFLRKHVKHDGHAEGIKSKHAMLREDFDGERSTGVGEPREERVYTRPHALRKTMRSTNSSNIGIGRGDPAAQSETYDAPREDGDDDGDEDVIRPVETTPHVPAWQAATDTSRPYGEEDSSLYSTPASGVDAHAVPETAPPPALMSHAATLDTSRAYGDEAALREAAAAGGADGQGSGSGPGPGLIEHHSTVMESTPVVGRPVPHSLMSNSVHARFGDGFEGGEEQDAMAR